MSKSSWKASCYGGGAAFCIVRKSRGSSATARNELHKQAPGGTAAAAMGV